MSPEHGTPIFREVQHFGATLRWLVLVSMAAVAALSYYAIFYIASEAPTTGVAVFAIASLVFLPLATAAMLFVARLETEVREDGLYVRFFPFHLRHKRIEIRSLTECFARSYEPFKEYGGWGIRWWPNGRAYCASGKRGVQLRFARDEGVLIGSQRAEELEAAIKSITSAGS